MNNEKPITVYISILFSYLITFTLINIYPTRTSQYNFLDDILLLRPEPRIWEKGVNRKFSIYFFINKQLFIDEVPDLLSEFCDNSISNLCRVP